MMRNKPRALFLLTAIVCQLLVVGGCKPTYTNENLEKSIIDVCKKEYKIDVNVKRAGRTVGIYLPVNALFESTAKSKGRDVTPEDPLAGIKFTKDAIDKMEDVSMALLRVALSNDAPVDFYVLIVADKKASGLEIIITRYVMDMKRFILNDVSMRDYRQRLLMDMDFGPVAAAEETVKEFFSDLERLPLQIMISRYFSRTINVRLESGDFFLYLSESAYKAARKFYVTDIKGIQVEKGKVLVKCKVKETYKALPGYENFKFLNPSGTTSEYLFLLDTSYIPYMIEQVFPVTKNSSYPERFKDYENLKAWEKGSFYLEDIKFPDFLARQLAARIKDLYQAGSGLKPKFNINLVKGEYIIKDKRFKIILDLEKKSLVSKEKTDFNGAWKIISNVMRRYDFKDYESVEIFNIADAKREIMTRPELLDRFWPKWLLKK